MTELFGLMIPTGTLVWSGGGQVISLVLAGALALAAAGLYAIREPARQPAQKSSGRTDVCEPDRRLPSAA